MKNQRRSRKEMLSVILQAIAEKDSRQTELSEKLHIYAQTTTECLAALKAKGLISQDNWTYSITAMGKHACQVLHAAELIWND
jgi:predicted transcriptional regulator